MAQEQEIDDEKTRGGETRGEHLEGEAPSLAIELYRQLEKQQASFSADVARLTERLETRVNFRSRMVAVILTAVGIAFLSGVAFRLWRIDAKMESVRQSALQSVHRASDITAAAEKRMAARLREVQDVVSQRASAFDEFTVQARNDLQLLVNQAHNEVQTVRATRDQMLTALEEQQKALQVLFEDYIAVQRERPAPEADRVTVLNARADASIERGDIAEAVSYIKQAIQPGSQGEAQDFHHLGVTARKIEQHELALQVFKAGLQRHPNDPVLKQDIASHAEREENSEPAQKPSTERTESDANARDAMAF